MLKLLDKTSVWILLVPAILLGIAPMGSQPHIAEKIGMMMSGTLTKPIDIFDLVLHSIFSIVLLVKIVRMLVLKKQN
jgi:hypothetical protein